MNRVFKMLSSVWLIVLCSLSTAPAEEEPGHGKWERAGKEVKEASEAVLDATRDTSRKVWEKTRDESGELYEKAAEQSDELLDKTGETWEWIKIESFEAWQKAKEESGELYQKTRKKIHEATAPEPGQADGLENAAAPEQLETEAAEPDDTQPEASAPTGQLHD